MTKQSAWQAVKYVLFSASAGIIQTVSFVLLFNVIMGSREQLYWVCHVSALALSVLWNFTLNRKFTFHSAANVPIAMVKVACFYLVFTPTTAWLGQRLVGSGWNGLLVEVLTMLLNFVLEFLYFKYVVFREKQAQKS